MKRRVDPQLTASFANAVLARGELNCWLAPHDPYRRPCLGRVEIFHFINRQRIRNSLGALDLDPDLILLAEWDDRLAALACEIHHRRLDSHLMPPLLVPQIVLPNHVREGVADWGLESDLDRRFI